MLPPMIAELGALVAFAIGFAYFDRAKDDLEGAL